jgi:formylglycine-generating enzyme required for sulfatase activity
LFDVDGNVSEWTSDSAGSRGDERVVVGSSWHSEIGRPARKNFPADTAFNTIGIRLARDIPVTPPADS